MKRNILLISAFLLSSIVLGCQLFSVDTDSIIATKVAEEIDKKFSEMQLMDNALSDASAVPIQATYTPYPTSTPYPIQVPSSSSYNTYNYSYLIGTPGGCLNAAFISETIPDNTVFPPGDGFIKSWTIKNTGYCEWNKNFRLVFLSGSSMSGNTFSYLTDTVSPGETVTLNANLTAPSSTGTYRGEWRVQSDLGVNFARFWVQIVVN